VARYILQRLLVIPLALAVVILLTYAYAHTVQWDYATRYPQLFNRLKNLQQRPESLVDAYREYLPALLKFDLGALRNGQDIAPVLRDALAASMGLLFLALLLSAPLGIGLGILAARWNSQRPARWLTTISTAGLAMPSFYVGSLLILVSVAYALWSKRSGALPFPLAGFGWDRHMVFPTLALMVRPTVQIAQVTGTLLTDELNKQYVVAARSMGHKWGTVKHRLAFRNILAPVILTIAGSLRSLMTSLILVEWMFFWPGLGRFLAATLIPASRTDMASSPYLLDPAFTTALITLITAIFLVADFIASVAVRLLDPRLRMPTAEEVADV
jgi:peptide/nickel transport system permease protein